MGIAKLRNKQGGERSPGYLLNGDHRRAVPVTANGNSASPSLLALSGLRTGTPFACERVEKGRGNL